MNLSLRYSIDISESSWQVIAGHLIEAEIPKIERYRTHFMRAVTVSSTITKPNIETSISKMEGRG